MLQSESIDPIVPAGASALSVHWDMDGVLVDSEFLYTEKLTAVARRYGVEIRREYFAQPQTFDIPDAEGGYRQASMPLHGAGDKNIYYFLLALNPRLQYELSMAQWLEELLAHYITQRRRLQPRERVVEVAEALARRGAFQSIVTSGIRAQVEANLETMGPAANHMAFALTADDVKYSKPNPQGYLISKDRATAHWREHGVGPADVFHVAIEDSPAGVRAARCGPLLHSVLAAGSASRFAAARIAVQQRAHLSAAGGRARTASLTCVAELGQEKAPISNKPTGVENEEIIELS